MREIRTIMTSEPITVTPETEVTKVAEILLERHINGVPVVDDDGELVGIVCQSDLIAQQKDLPTPSFFTFLDGLISLTSMKQIEKEVRKVTGTTTADIMTPDPVSVAPNMPVSAVASLMVEQKFHTIPVVEDGKLVGIVGKEDIIRNLIPKPQ